MLRPPGPAGLARTSRESAKRGLALRNPTSRGPTLGGPAGRSVVTDLAIARFGINIAEILGDRERSLGVVDLVASTRSAVLEAIIALSGVQTCGKRKSRFFI